MKAVAAIVCALLTFALGRAQPSLGAVREEPKQRLYVLPLAFSPESEKNYPAWIKRLRADGLGNAVWQEIEEVLFDHPRYTVLQSPVSNEEFLKIIAARQANAANGLPGDPLYELPEKVVTVNSNFFTRTEPGLSLGQTRLQASFQVTIYLRFYDLGSGKLNRAIPAQADAVGSDPITTTRKATREAVAILLQRLEKSAKPAAR